MRSTSSLSRGHRVWMMILLLTCLTSSCFIEVSVCSAELSWRGQTLFKIGGVQTAIKSYYMDHGRVPDEDIWKKQLTMKSSFGGPYVTNKPDSFLDVWDRPLTYRRISDMSYLVISKGSDGVEGTRCDIYDKYAVDQKYLSKYQSNLKPCGPFMGPPPNYSYIDPIWFDLFVVLFVLLSFVTSIRWGRRSAKPL